VILDIKAGIIEVATDIYDLIKNWGKPAPLTPLEKLVARHEAIEKKYEVITKKYWDTNAHLLDDDEVFMKIYGARVKLADSGWEKLGPRLKKRCSIFNIQNMVTEQTMIALRINFIRNYMAQVVKVIFDAHLNIQYKIQSDKLMHLFFIYENKVNTMKQSSKKLRRPSQTMFKGAQKILQQTVKVIR